MKRIEREVDFAEIIPIIEESFRQDLTVTLPVTGNSMRPLFVHKRDSVILAACDPRSLKRGDVPFYRRDDGHYVLHRIVRVEDRSYTLVGDAQSDLERGLPKENVLAVMTGFVRKGKTVSCHNTWYRVYVAVWLWIVPFRSCLFRVFRSVRNIFRKKR